MLTLKAAEAKALATRQHWRVEVFDAQLGGSMMFYFASKPDALANIRRTGGWLERFDGNQWVRTIGTPTK